MGRELMNAPDAWPPVSKSKDEETDEATRLGWVEPECTDFWDIPEGYRAWLARADVPDVSDEAIRAARDEIQRLILPWLEAYPDAEKQPRPAQVPPLVADAVMDLGDTLRALEHFLVDAAVQDTAALPYVRDLLYLQVNIFERHAAGTLLADTYRIALDTLLEVYPENIGFRIRKGEYKGRCSPF